MQKQNGIIVFLFFRTCNAGLGASCLWKTLIAVQMSIHSDMFEENTKNQMTQLCVHLSFCGRIDNYFPVICRRSTTNPNKCYFRWFWELKRAVFEANKTFVLTCCWESWKLVLHRFLMCYWLIKSHRNPTIHTLLDTAYPDLKALLNSWFTPTWT